MENNIRTTDGARIELDNARWMDVIKKPIVVNALQMKIDFEVDTLEGTHRGNAGDFLMKGIDGEMYPIKKDIFERTYEIVTDDNIF